MSKLASRHNHSALNIFSGYPLGFLVLVMIFPLVFFLPAPDQAFAQSDLAEIEFWQSVKSSPDPQELRAYLDIYPKGKFAPLARLRIKKLAPKPDATPQPATAPEKPVLRDIPQFPSPAAPPPPLDLPVFKPETASETDASCRLKLGQQGIAQADFSGTGSICLCRAPFEISPDGTSCITPAGIEPPPPRKPDSVISRPRPRPRTRPVKVRKQPRPVRAKRRPVKRPPRARAIAIANRYCRRRYGSDLKSVVVKKSKFYCHYRLSGDDNYLGVKKKKFKDVSG